MTSLQQELNLSTFLLTILRLENQLEKLEKWSAVAQGCLLSGAALIGGETAENARYV